jgi:hypothetical protein
MKTAIAFKYSSRGSENGLALRNCRQYLFVCGCLNDRIQLFDAMNGTFVTQNLILSWIHVTIRI